MNASVDADKLKEFLLRHDNLEVTFDEDDAQSLARDAANEVENDTRTTVEEIAGIWIQIGLSSADMLERIHEMKGLHFSVNKNSLNTEKLSLEKLKRFIENKLCEINQILDDLTLAQFVAPTDRSLKEVGRILIKKHEDLHALKKERLEQMTELMAKRDKLLKSMNKSPKTWKTATNIPSEEELMHLQTDVSDLYKEYDKRYKQYLLLRKVVQDLFEQLEREVISQFEKRVIFDKSEDFILSDEHLKNLDALHSELESCYKNNNERRKQMEKRLESLWDRLDVEQSYRDGFYRNKNGCKPSVLALIQEEVVKYEELKRQNIEMFVLKVRSELLEWYDKCYISEEQKDPFRPYLESNEFSEELLESHETEVQKMQNHYEECEEMYNKLEEWQQLWERLKELENKANDPNRFNNRGGALLAEEREKNQIRKKLPKLETSLKKFSEDRFRDKSEHFLVFGVPVKSYVENQKMEYQDMKENEKRERQRLKQMELNAQLKGKKMTPVGGVVLRKTPQKRTFTPTSPVANGGSMSKVRRVGGPLTPSRVANEINTQTLTKRVVNRPNPAPRARARNVQAQINRMGEEPFYEASVLSIDEDAFQAPLGDRDNANSTFIQQRPQTPSRYVTKWREPKAQAMNRRLSRSCNDLSEAINAKLQITSGKQTPGIRSNPNSPQVKTGHGYTPSRLPRIALPQKRRAFLN